MSKRRASSPKARNWDKVQSKKSHQTVTNRDVLGDQQMDRTKKRTKLSATAGTVGSIILGVIVFILAWVVFSAVTMGVSSMNSMTESTTPGSGQGYYYGSDGETGKCYQQLTEGGLVSGKCYPSAEAVPVPDWYASAEAEAKAAAPQTEESDEAITMGESLATGGMMKWWLCLGLGVMTGIIVGSLNSGRVRVGNLMVDHSDINPYENDAFIQLPEEVQRRYDIFPDAGAHSSVEVSSMISHNMFENKGLAKVRQTVRAEADELDEDGSIIYYKGEAKANDDGSVLTKTVPMIDEEFVDGLFSASGTPKEKNLRKTFDTRQIEYNPKGANRDKLGANTKGTTVYGTVADLINKDWDLPEYEVARPAGAYIVDTAPVNTMVLAMTRAGKGQTYIEPVIDMWSREKNPSNMVINDPKGELLVNNYIPLVNRGFIPVQFNLINPMKTDIYNPLGMAAEAAREGDFMKCAQYVENIANVFFPVDGGEDPVWPNAANNAFKRAAYGLIDFYLEEERELREYAMANRMDLGVLEQKLDDMWGKVTLYNCYQMFVQLTSKKVKNPEAELQARANKGEFSEDEDASRLEAEQLKAQAQAFLWEGKPEQDMLTLYFNATEALPRNTMRSMIGNTNNALRAMAGAEKMLASVYGIAITAMAFFTDPTISTLTSGKPSQNIDLAGLSFPRRLGVRFSVNYLKRDNLVGQQAKWSAYGDPMFTENLGKDFTHEEIIFREGWARYNFKGIFPNDEAWLKLELVNPQTSMLIRVFYFHFKKSYQLSMSGRHYIIEPVTGQKVIKDGVMRELKPVHATREVVQEDGSSVTERYIKEYAEGETTFAQDKLDLDSAGLEKYKGKTRAIMRSLVKYQEKPKAVFLVTPPHLMKYAKLILILVKQLVDVSFDQSYMTKANQKPLYRTRFMLDELGNLKSEGKGIDGFETMLSIGLGQEQQFTLILQTLQQLREIYGESVDKIVQGNVSNIIFLKSTDDSMIETLEKMSGKTHKSYGDGKSITRNTGKAVGQKNDGTVTYNFNTKEEPLISYNDLTYLPERNSVVFRAGDSPIWNRNETILPMAHKLVRNDAKMIHPGHDYTLQTIPTLSSAMEFDVRMNQPDFKKILDKRMKQSLESEPSMELYADAYGYKDVDVERLDPDVYAEDIMEIVQMRVNDAEGLDPHAMQFVDSDDMVTSVINDDAVEDNIEVTRQAGVRMEQRVDLEKERYADGRISRAMLINPDGTAKENLEVQISEAFRRVKVELLRDQQNFKAGSDGSLLSADGAITYITPTHSREHAEAAAKLNAATSSEETSTYAEDDLGSADVANLMTVDVHPAFYQFLASLPGWGQLARGEWDRAMAVEMKRSE